MHSSATVAANAVISGEVTIAAGAEVRINGVVQVEASGA